MAAVSRAIEAMFTEKPIVFGRTGLLVGISCTPAEPVRRAHMPAVVFLNAGIVHRVGPNRLYVKLARELARHGIRSLRFDLGGIGDSSIAPLEGGSVLDIVRRDITDAIDRMGDGTGNASVVLVGLCSGADNALESALRHPRVAGAVLIDPNIHRPASFFVHHYASRVLSGRTWKLLLTGRHPVYRRLLPGIGTTEDGAEPPSEALFLAPAVLPSREDRDAQFRTLVERGCRLLCVFTGGLGERFNHRGQFFRCYPSLRGSAGLVLEYFRAADHTLSARKDQERLVEAVVAWIESPGAWLTEAYPPRQRLVDQTGPGVSPP